MTIKTTPHQRQEMYRCHLQGESYAMIAEKHGLSQECVRYWCRRQRDQGCVRTEWHQTKRGLLSQFEPIVRYVILRLRLAHPRWGPDVLLFHLQQRPSLAGKRLPARASIGRYLHQWPRFRRRRRRGRSHPVASPEQPTRVHECWQIDFKLGIWLDDDTQVNLHTVYDPVGGACLTAQVTAAGDIGPRPKRVTDRELQKTIRHAFNRWQTLPESIQTDNEPVFVGQPDDPFPSRFTLWLAGLGIRHSRIRPGKPTDNAQVERSHQTVCNYAVIGNQHLSQPALQATLDQAIEQLAHLIPSRAAGCHGRAPVHAHPELLAQPRPWSPELELAHFDLQRVDALLASLSWQRRVGKTGQVCIGGHHRYYSVGRDYARQDVLVRFDPEDRSFVFYPLDAKQPTSIGPEIGRRPARFLSVEEITGLSEDKSGIGPQQLAFAFPEPSRGKLLMSKSG